METLWYAGPSGGEHVANPSPEWMIEQLRRGEEYWGPYSPVGVLCWHEHPPQKVPGRSGLGTATQRQQLLFIRHPKRGWYFEYSTSNLPEERWLVPVDPAANQDRYLTHWAFGEQLHFRAAAFIRQPTAEQVIVDFMTNRQPSTVVAWANFEDAQARLDDTGYRERRRNPSKGKPERRGNSSAD